MTVLVVARFDHADPFRAAERRLCDAGRHVVGRWTPMPLGDEREAQRWPSAAVMALVGLLSAAALYALIWWSAALAYPFNSGGRPLNSWPAFLVAPVEFGALFAGFAGIVTFLVRARLPRLYAHAFDIDEVGQAASDGFVLAIGCDAGDDANALIAMLAEAGAAHSRLIER